MFSIERKALIINQLEERGVVTVAQLAEMLAISKETIRRDLRELERDGMIKRTHGGAVLEIPENAAAEYPLKFREIKHHVEKKRLCVEAAKYIENGDTIFIDNSSTTVNLLGNINPSYQVTVVTNSIQLLMESAWLGNPNLTMISLGGVFRAKNYSLTGGLAAEWARTFRPDKSFISCRSINAEIGLSDGSIHELDTKRALIESTRKLYVLADHSKFLENGSFFFCDLSKVHMIITDNQVDEESVRQLRSKNVNLLII